MKDNNILLSICIASYNHAAELYQKASDILSCPEPGLELVICDNASTDNTAELLSSIKDSRFKFIANTENLGPVYNYMRVLAGGGGKYIMFVTDKDSLIFDNIKEILELLKNKNFAVGYFALDYPQNAAHCVSEFINPQSCFEEFAYLSKHPTGYLFNGELLQKLNIEQNFVDINKVGYFPFEFIAAELAKTGPGVIIHIPFCVTAKIPPGGKIFSGTYSGKNKNLFFSPSARIEQYQRYVRHLNTLELAFKESVLKKLVSMTYSLAIDVYKIIMQDIDKCLYYKAEPEVVDEKMVQEIEGQFLETIKSSGVFEHQRDRTLCADLLKSKIQKRRLNLFFKKIKNVLRNKK